MLGYTCIWKKLSKCWQVHFIYSCSAHIEIKIVCIPFQFGSDFPLECSLIPWLFLGNEHEYQANLKVAQLDQSIWMKTIHQV